jgi:regulator of protease activity HflC (stomatin/prohibitin superfamily)
MYDNMIGMGIGIGIGAGVFIAAGVRIVRPTHKMVIETLGKFNRTAESGFSWVIPLIQTTRYVNLTEQMVDVEPQMVITKDKLNAEVDAVVYYKVNEVKKSLYNVDDHKTQLTSLARTTLRAVIGKMSLTDANEKRNEVNSEVEKVLTKETASYGVSILRVEIQRIEPPRDVQDSMNNVVKAEQEKIAAMDLATAKETEADGDRRATIKRAEGNRQAAILEAEGKSQAFTLINKTFTGNSQILKKLEVTQKSLEKNSKIILTEKGINPQLIIGDLPLKVSK